MKSKPIKEVRITDPFTLGLVAEEQKRRGHKTATKTAAQMIYEWRTQVGSAVMGGGVKKQRASVGT